MNRGGLHVKQPWEADPSEEQALVEFLCGKIRSTEAWGACRYEYARHSEVLRRLAAFHRDGDANGYRREHASYPEQIVEDTLGVDTGEPFTFSDLWLCLGDYFPARPWRDIPKGLRPKAAAGIVPLRPMTTATFAHYGDKARQENELGQLDYRLALESGSGFRPGGPPPALFREGENGERLAVAFQLDLTKGKDALTASFAEFLNQLPENEGLLKRARRAASLDSATPHNWLRDLAMWRLNKRFAFKKKDVRDWMCENLKEPMRGERRAKGKSFAAVNRVDSSLERTADRMHEHRKVLFPFEGLQSQKHELKKETRLRIAKQWESLVNAHVTRT